MEDYFYLILLLLFFLAPVLERVLRRRRGQQQPAPPEADTSEWELTSERQQERPRPEYSQPRGTTAGGGQQGGRTGAEEVIPDDLWEILTGERRRPRQEPEYEPESEPEYEPGPEYEEPAATYEPGFDEGRWRIDAEEPPAAPERVPDYQRARLPEPAKDVGRTAPWGRAERVPPPEMERFKHEPLPTARAARQARMAPVRPEYEWAVPSRRRRPAFDLGLHDRDGLKRAVVLREVLGPPKGLER